MTVLQATVRSHGPDGGTLLTDDGRLLVHTAAALDPAVRLLRSGQRVAVRLDGAAADATVVAVTLVGLPLR